MTQPHRRQGHGRTQQGYVPSPGPQQAGQIRPPRRQQSPAASPAAAPAAASGQQQQPSPQPAGQRVIVRQGGEAKPQFRGGWHRVVLAEFIATLIIITAQGLLAPRKTGDKASKQGVSVSFAPPLVRLTAACVLFFALALIASGDKAGKLAAAFGALVLAGTALNAGPMWDELGRAIGGTKPKTAAPASGGGGAGGRELAA